MGLRFRGHASLLLGLLGFLQGHAWRWLSSHAEAGRCGYEDVGKVMPIHCCCHAGLGQEER
eukprot:954298-Amphidinium_carterae.1